MNEVLQTLKDKYFLCLYSKISIIIEEEDTLSTIKNSKSIRDYWTSCTDTLKRNSYTEEKDKLIQGVSRKRITHARTVVKHKESENSEYYKTKKMAKNQYISFSNNGIIITI